MKCPHCNAENRDGAGYCAWCGQRLVQPQESAAAATSPVAVSEMSGPPSLESADEKSIMAAQESAYSAETAAAPSEPVVSMAVPLAPGILLDGRYRIVELLASSPTHNRYKAIDTRFCRSCDAADNAEDDVYCRQCGAVLEPRRSVIFEEHLRVIPPAYDIHLNIEQRDYYGTILKPVGAPLTGEKRGLRIRWGLATDKGRQRDINEDYLEGWIYSLSEGELYALFVVADGLGGQDSGEVASRLTVDTLWQTLRQEVFDQLPTGGAPDAEVLAGALRKAVMTANNLVYQTRLERKSQMSSTVTAALIAGSTAYIANVGDSRTYVFGPQGLVRITKDHSLVQRLVDTGQITPQEVYSHPRRNLIYQSIGDRSDIQVDQFMHQLKSEERLVLCSDGLWEMVHEDGLEEVLLAESDPQLACDRLVKNANMAGGEDNISIIIAQFFL